MSFSIAAPQWLQVTSSQPNFVEKFVVIEIHVMQPLWRKSGEKCGND